MAELSRGQILKNPEVIGAGTTGASIRLLDADENSYIDLKVPDTVGTAYTFTLPSDDGTANQVLQTDGTGTTSWASIDLSPAGSTGQIQYNNAGSFAGAAVTTNGTDIYLTGPGAGLTAYVRFENGGGTANISIGASTVTADRTYLLPDTVGNVGQVLKINGKPDSNTATLSWENDNTGSGGSSASGGAGDVQISDGAGNFTSDTDLNFDTTNTRLNIGNKTDAGGNLFVEGTFFEPVQIKVTDSTATFGPRLGIYRESTTPAAADGLGYFYYYGAYTDPGPPSSTIQDYSYGILGVSIVDPTLDSTSGASYGPFGKLNLYLATRDQGSAALARTVDYSPNLHRHTVNWPVSSVFYTGYLFEVTTSQGGGVNNITPDAGSNLCEFSYQGNTKYQLSIDGVVTNFGMSLADSDGSNFVDIKAPASVTSNYTITLPAAGGAANEILQYDGSQNASFVSNTRTLNFVIDGGGSAITTGKKGVVVVDGDYTVTGWTIIADQSGSIVVDVNRATFTNFPTTSSIAGTELPTLSSAQKAEDLTLSSWTTTLSARDVIEFEVDSATTVTRVTVALRLVPR